MQTFNLDISLRGVTPLLHAKQGDVGRKFKVILTEGGNPYTVPDGVDVSVWYSGVSGVGNYTKIDEESAVSITGNEMTVELISQMLNNAGEGTLCLVMKDADSRQLGTWNITYIVQAVPGFGSKPAEQHFSVVDKYIEDAINKKAFVKTVNGIAPDENGNVNVEGGGGSGGIAKETDPTVPAWAKQPTKPTYTAAEVGAMAANTPVVKSVNGTTPDVNGNVTVEVESGVSDYTELTNKPKINGVEVSGDKTSADYGIGNPTDEQVAASVEAWLDAHPEATTTVADGSITTAKLADKSVTPFKLADGMFDAVRTANLFNADEHYLPGKKLRANGVVMDDNADNDVVYMVPAEGNKSYVITPSAVTVEGSTGSTCSVYFYRSDKTLISYATVYVNKCRLTPVNAATPAETAFISVNIYHQTDGAKGLMIVEGESKDDIDWNTYIPYYNFNLNSGNTVSTEQVVGLGEFVDARTSAFETKENAETERNRRTDRVVSENLIDYTTMVTPYKTISSGGHITDSEKTDLVEMLPVKPETTYSLSGSAISRLVDDRYVVYDSNDFNNAQNVVFYDANKTRLSYVLISGNVTMYPTFRIDTPANCAYMSFSFLHYDVPTVVLVEGAVDGHQPITPYYKYKPTPGMTIPAKNIPWIAEHIKSSPLFIPAKVNISAHRGDMHDFPENTIPAFESAGKKGVFAIETDVYPTSDGVLMCLHDATVDRTTDGTGNLSDMTYEQATALNIDYGSNVADYADNPLKIPTFAEYLKVCKKYGCVALVHLQMADETYISKVYKAVKNTGMVKSSVFVSWAYDDVKAIRALDDEVCVGVAYYSVTSQTLTELERLGGCIGVHALAKNAITEEVVNEAHSRGIYVFSGCDDSNETSAKETLEYWYNLGVDNIVHSMLDVSIL